MAQASAGSSGEEEAESGREPSALTRVPQERRLRAKLMEVWDTSASLGAQAGSRNARGSMF